MLLLSVYYQVVLNSMDILICLAISVKGFETNGQNEFAFQKLITGAKVRNELEGSNCGSWEANAMTTPLGNCSLGWMTVCYIQFPVVS